MSRKILVGHVLIAHSWSRERYYLRYVLQLLWSKNLCNKIIFEHVLIAHSWPGNGALCGEQQNLFGKSLRQMAAGSTSSKCYAFLLCLHHGKSMIMRNYDYSNTDCTKPYNQQCIECVSYCDVVQSGPDVCQCIPKMHCTSPVYSTECKKETMHRVHNMIWFG